MPTSHLVTYAICISNRVLCPRASKPSDVVQYAYINIASLLLCLIFLLARTSMNFITHANTSAANETAALADIAIV